MKGTDVDRKSYKVSPETIRSECLYEPGACLSDLLREGVKPFLCDQEAVIW